MKSRAQGKVYKLAIRVPKPDWIPGQELDKNKEILFLSFCSKSIINKGA
jgi:hypothetical protein